MIQIRQKKGQTATEYLIILAVVIVIALIVVGVLGGIPSIGGGAKSNSVNSYWKTAKIGIDSISVYDRADDAIVNITFRNNLPQSIKITSVTLTDSSGHTNTTTANSIVTAGGTSANYMMNVTSAGLDATDSYAFDLEVGYTDIDTSATYTFTGDGNKLEGTVSSS